MKKLLGIVIAVFMLTTVSANAKNIKMNLNAIYGSTSIHTKGVMRFAKLVLTSSTFEVEAFLLALFPYVVYYLPSHMMK